MIPALASNIMRETYYTPQRVTPLQDSALLIQDPIYGQVRIQDSILVDLIQCRSMQRLKGVLQHGITGLIGITPPVTRFEHSVGAMLLVRRLGASLDEQIAALLHDVSHTALSHVIDHVFKGERSFHEQQKEAYLTRTEIPDILASYNLDWHKFVDEEDYPLLEQPAPRLCADRLDYGLRDSVAFGILKIEQAQNIVEQLVVQQERIVCSKANIALELAEAYMEADNLAWSNLHKACLYELSAKIISDSISRGILRMEDLWLKDTEFWMRLTNCDDRDIRDRVQSVSPDTLFIEDESNPSFKLRLKVRTIDPDIADDRRLVLLSELNESYLHKRTQYIESKNKVFFMRIVNKDSS
ncbi:uncharacterized protein VTP21DRAFT_8220 [Calcarisporiella thermophila]|uniref:uncharacterized protein n=1 Tax=Calcarisporiella thermophila TaxID=911321 RepID=UPI0037430532